MRDQSRHLSLDGNIDDDSSLQTFTGVLGEERNVEDDHVVGLSLFENSCVHESTHGRMHDGVQLLQCIGIAEHDAGHRGSIECAIGREDVRTECIGQLLEHGRTRLLNLASDRIGIDHDRTSLAEELRDGRLSRSDTTGESDENHDVTLRRRHVDCRGRPEVTLVSRYSHPMSEPTPARLRLVVADDHALFRELLVDRLRAAGHDVVAEASDGRQAVRVIRQHEPDLVLMDVAMPFQDGITAMKDVLAVDRRRRIVMLSMHLDVLTIKHALASGARGYLSKECSFDEIDRAVHDVCTGDTVLSVDVREILSGSPETATGDSLLTEREQQVLELVAEGANTADIASRLYISQKTVKNHLASVYDKLEVDDRTQALVRATRLGLVRIERDR